MQANDADVKFLATYYQDGNFVAWLTYYNFVGVTAQNVAKYYVVYHKAVLCQEHRCDECDGMALLPGMPEHTISNGTIPQQKCPIRIQDEQREAAMTLSNTFKPPPVFANVNLDTLTKLSPAVKPTLDSYVLNYEPRIKNGLYIYSAEHGIGRSTVMWWLLTTLVRKFKIHTGYISETSGMFSEKIVCDSKEDGHPFFKLAISCDILMIDDLGSENYTTGYTERLVTILEDRYRNLKPVVVSSVRAFEPWAWTDGREPEIFSKLSKLCTLLRLDDVAVDEGIV